MSTDSDPMDTEPATAAVGTGTSGGRGGGGDNSNNKSAPPDAAPKRGEEEEQTHPESRGGGQSSKISSGGAPSVSVALLDASQHRLARDLSQGMNPINLATGIYGPRGERIRHVVHEGSLRLPVTALSILLSSAPELEGVAAAGQDGPRVPSPRSSSSSIVLPGLDSVVRPSLDLDVPTVIVTDVMSVVPPTRPDTAAGGVAAVVETAVTVARNRLVTFAATPATQLPSAAAADPERIRGGGDEGGVESAPPTTETVETAVAGGATAAEQPSGPSLPTFGASAVPPAAPVPSSSALPSADPMEPSPVPVPRPTAEAALPSQPSTSSVGTPPAMQPFPVPPPSLNVAPPPPHLPPHPPVLHPAAVRPSTAESASLAAPSSQFVPPRSGSVASTPAVPTASSITAPTAGAGALQVQAQPSQLTTVPVTVAAGGPGNTASVPTTVNLGAAAHASPAPAPLPLASASTSSSSAPAPSPAAAHPIVPAAGPPPAVVATSAATAPNAVGMTTTATAAAPTPQPLTVASTSAPPAPQVPSDGTAPAPVLAPPTSVTAVPSQSAAPIPPIAPSSTTQATPTATSGLTAPAPQPVPQPPSPPQVIPLKDRPNAQWEQHIPGPNEESQIDTANKTPKPDWYASNGISELERTVLYEWFDGSASHRTPESYVAAREKILEMSGKLGTRYLTSTMVRRTLVGDVTSLTRLHDFLTTHALINEDSQNDSAPTPWCLQDDKNKRSIAWTDEMKEDLLVAVVEQSRRAAKRPRLLDESRAAAPTPAAINIDWEEVSRRVGHGVRSKDCEREFLALPIAPENDSLSTTTADRPITPDEHGLLTRAGDGKADSLPMAGETAKSAHHEVLQEILDGCDPDLARAVTESALQLSDGSLKRAQASARVGLVLSRAVDVARSKEESVAHLLSEIVDLRMKKLENRLALLDDVEGMLEAERVALELERRDLYTARCRHWFGGP